MGEGLKTFSVSKKDLQCLECQLRNEDGAKYEGEVVHPVIYGGVKSVISLAVTKRRD